MATAAAETAAPRGPNTPSTEGDAADFPRRVQEKSAELRGRDGHQWQFASRRVAKPLHFPYEFSPREFLGLTLRLSCSEDPFPGPPQANLCHLWPPWPRRRADGRFPLLWPVLLLSVFRPVVARPIPPHFPPPHGSANRACIEEARRISHFSPGVFYFTQCLYFVVLQFSRLRTGSDSGILLTNLPAQSEISVEKGRLGISADSAAVSGIVLPDPFGKFRSLRFSPPPHKPLCVISAGLRRLSRKAPKRGVTELVMNCGLLRLLHFGCALQ